MKKVTFGAKKTRDTSASPIDNWVENRQVVPQTPQLPREQMKRLTIDVPIPLHKRIKSQCALNNLVMADVIRDLLEQRFPAPPDPEQAGPS